jgi:hypothetical protein
MAAEMIGIVVAAAGSMNNVYDAAQLKIFL